MRVRLLGEPELEVAGAPVELGSPKQRALLAALALQPGTAVSAGRLADVLWGDDPPASAGETLRSLVYRLRRGVAAAGGDADLIAGGGSAYRLVVEPDAVDAHGFERLRAAGRAAAGDEDWDRAARAWRAALELWRGPALGTVAGLPALRAVAVRLDGARLEAVEDLAEAHLALGRPGEALAALDGHLAEAALRERAWAARMLALYRLGRRAEALAAYAAVRDLLVAELGVEPGDALRELHVAILQGRPELLLPAPAARRACADPRHNLPSAVSAFIGRAGECGSVGAQLDRARLVTLVGPGGAGKTRLAVEVGGAALDGFPDGVWLVELAAVADPGRLVEAVVAAVGMDPGAAGSGPADLQAALVAHLAPRRMLLVVDNCEHQTGAVAQLVQVLLGSCPGLRVLATTREVLGVPGEVVAPVGGLGLPEREKPSAADVAASDAASLFCERAGRASPGFRLTEENAAAVARICRRLDGLPLALELAAPRLRLLSAEQLAASLEDHSALLLDAARPLQARHATLTATLDWSHRLLTPPEQVALRRLAVFPADFGLAAALAVVGTVPGSPGEHPSAPLTLLTRLLDKSMVTVSQAGGEPRYRLLETVRAYAGAKLADAGEAAAVRDRHRDAHVAQAYWFSECLDGRWLRRARSESANVEAALQWCAERGDGATLLRLAAQQWTHWFFAGNLAGRRWLEQAVAVDDPAWAAERAFVRCGLAQWIRTDGRPAGRARSAALLEEALAICLEHGDARSATWVHAYGAQIAAVEGDHARARAVLADCAARFSALGDERAEATCRAVLAGASMTSTDRAGALDQARRAAELTQRNPDSYLAAHTQAQLAVAEAAAGEAERAAHAASRALAAARALPGSRTLAMSLARAVEATVILGRPEDGRADLRELLALLLHTGLPDWVAASLELAALTVGEERPDAALELLAGAAALRRQLGEGGTTDAIVERHHEAVARYRGRLGLGPTDDPNPDGDHRSPRQLLIRALAALDA